MSVMKKNSGHLYYQKDIDYIPVLDQWLFDQYKIIIKRNCII